MYKKYNRTLTIAGSDSGGGAGIQADLKTFSALGCYGSSVITAVTAQNTIGVKSIHPIPPHMVKEQIEAVLEDIGTDALKIGMLYSAEVIKVVADMLQQYNPRNIVIDPVMISTSGKNLLQPEAIKLLKEQLIPMADIITPNIPEAEVLLGRKIKGQSDLPQATKDLSKDGSLSVILKAGHLDADLLVDYFYDSQAETMLELPSIRLETKNTHGTGCTLSSAIASYLAKGLTQSEAVKNAKHYLSNALIQGSDYNIGRGHGPVKHFI